MDKAKYLDELIRLAEKKEIPYSKKYLEKQSEETLERIYEKHHEQELDELNESIVDTVIGKFDELMKGCRLVSKHSELGKKLQNKKLFRQDLKSFVVLFTLLFPYVGLLEGAVCVEIINNNDNKNEQDENSETKSDEGGEQNSSEEKPDSRESSPDSEDTKL